ANPAVVQGIRELVSSKASIECVNEVLTMHMGPDFILANLSVDFRDSITADEVERTIGEMDGSIKEQFPQVKRIFIEAEKRIGLDG
ncbi:MAG: cation transporter, partial [Candidatus Thiodiazotropha sp. (ex Lucinoma borealis)]|nr:cation transporter [Candidatus Thiodiazotropha sp. (ex Lucinoma borealis)]